MAAYVRQRPPRWFRSVALIATAWGVFCCFFYLRQLLSGAAAMGPFDAAHFAPLPGWYAPVHGLAVAGLTLGGVAMLARAATARMLFALAFAALVVQFAMTLAGTPLLHGAAALAFPGLLIVVAAVETWFTHQARRRGWIC